jgi:hypothetical protein
VPNSRSAGWVPKTRRVESNLGGLGGWGLRGSATPSLILALTVAATTGSMLSMATKDRVRALALPAAPEGPIAFLLGGRDGRLLLLALFAVLGFRL